MGAHPLPPGRTSFFWMSVVSAFALIVFFEWRTDEETITLAVIVASAAVCGFVRPRLFWVAGIVLGVAVAAADVTMGLTGWLPRYAAKPPTLGGSISLVVLAVPSLIGAAIGAGIGRLAHRSA